MNADKPLKPYPHRLGFRHAWFYDEIYQLNFRVIFPKKGKELTNKDIEAYLKSNFGAAYDKGNEDWNACLITLETSRGANLPVFCFKNPDPYIWDIAHECVHAANGILKQYGIKFDPENDESYAYLLGSLVRRVAKCLGRK